MLSILEGCGRDSKVARTVVLQVGLIDGMGGRTAVIEVNMVRRPACGTTAEQGHA